MAGRICGKKLQTSDILAGLKAWRCPVTLQEQASNALVTPTEHKSATSSNASGTTQEPLTGERADHNGIYIDSLRDQNNKTTPPPPPVSKPVRLISAYAGTTVESFGEYAPLVVEILAEDGFGTSTKAFSKALETLAMWRAIYGEAAFIHGLQVSADKRKGHRYVGGVAKRYDPETDREPLRSIDGGLNASDLLPTISDLLDSGEIEEWTVSAEEIAKRPAGLVAILEAQKAAAL